MTENKAKDMPKKVLNIEILLEHLPGYSEQHAQGYLDHLDEAWVSANLQASVSGVNVRVKKSESVSVKDLQAEIVYWEGVIKRCKEMPEYIAEVDYAEMIILRLQALLPKKENHPDSHLVCPGCGIDAGHDRECPPNPYYCDTCDKHLKDGD